MTPHRQARLVDADPDGITVTAFCDGRALKQGTSWSGTTILAPAGLDSIGRDAHVFICANYQFSMPRRLAELGFSNVHDCADLLADFDFTAAGAE